MSEQYTSHEPNMSLPQPVGHEKPEQQPYEKQKTQAVETGQATTSAAGTSSASVTASSPVVSNPQTGSVSSGSSPQIADDVDLIEKEWVERAKRIVEQTKNDPHQQSEELHATKDDYQLKRFNRDTNLKDAA